MTFYRNEAWRDVVTINRDAAIKAPNNARAHANYATALLRAQRYDDALTEAKRAIALGKPGLEDYTVSANTIIGVYMEQKRWQEAAQEGESFIDLRPEKSDASALPQLCLRVAESYRQLGELSKAYQYTMKSLSVQQQLPFAPPSLIAFIIEEIRSLLKAARDKNIDLNSDGLADPGDQPIGTWVARVFIEHGAYTEASRLLEQILADQPDDEVTAVLLNKLQMDMESNRDQGQQWSFDNKYVRKPFSPFNISMAIAYLIRKYNAREPVMQLGDLSLTWAEWMKPDHPDVHLLKGWYSYERGNYQEAAEEANRAIKLDPEYAKAWLGLGFFLSKTDDKKGAIRAFEKTLELYPGYREKRTIHELIAQLYQSKQQKQSEEDKKNFSNEFSESSILPAKSLPRMN